MNWIFYLGQWCQVTVITEGEEYRLTVPGKRMFITLSRQGLEQAMRDYYGLRSSSPFPAREPFTVS
nr:hypothetical protein [uncultured Enterobacter sp.]